MGSTLENFRIRNFGFSYWSFFNLAAYCLIGTTFHLGYSAPAITPEYGTHLNHLETDVQQEIEKTQKDIDSLLIKLNRVELAPENSPQRLINAETKDLRKKLKNYLSAALKMKAKHLDQLKKQKSYLMSEYLIEQNISSLPQPKKLTRLEKFRCDYFPIKQEEESTTLEKIFSFGEFVNPVLGKSSAKVQGLWWGNTFGSLIRSCASGEVVLSEYVEGRGHVVGIRHGASDYTLYGNLDATSVRGLKTGTKIPKGAALGFALERFYFEVRKNGEAVDPLLVFGQETDVKTARNSKIE